MATRPVGDERLTSLAKTLLLAGALVLATSIYSVTNCRAQDTLQLHLHQRGHWYRDGFLGLSYEAPVLKTDNFSLGNKVYVRLLENLGPGWFRFGGSSVDNTFWKSVPAGVTGQHDVLNPQDLLNVLRFARAIGWKVILGVDLGHFVRAQVADEARFAYKHGGSTLKAIEIGNEPDYYHDSGMRPKDYSYTQYRHDYEQCVAAVKSGAPYVPIAAPAFSFNQKLFRSFVHDESRTVSLFTFHIYPTGAVHKPTPAHLSSLQVAQRTANTAPALLAITAPTHVSLRIGEMNSAYGGGFEGTSNVYASALWLADSLCRFANLGIVGVNLHNGFYGGGYVTINDRNGVFSPATEYYGALLYHLGAVGHTVPVSLTSTHNVGAYAGRSTDGTIRITVINREPVHTERLLVHLPAGYQTGVALNLRARAITSQTHITIGGASVDLNGRWKPVRAHAVAVKSGVAVILVEPLSAQLVTFRRRMKG